MVVAAERTRIYQTGARRKERICEARRPRPSQAVAEQYMVGDYYADYSELSFEEISAPVPGMDEFLAQCRVVSTSGKI